VYPGVELRLYRYVGVLAEELNFTRAAARLHVAQPSLSKGAHAAKGQHRGPWSMGYSPLIDLRILSKYDGTCRMPFHNHLFYGQSQGHG